MTTYTAATRTAQRLTQTIPIVMAVSADAVREGLVESLSRPAATQPATPSFHGADWQKGLQHCVRLCLEHAVWRR